MVEAVKLLCLCVLCVTAPLACPSAARAHQLDECLQSTLVVIDPSAIRLQMILTPGVSIADKVLALMDRDTDGTISNNETTAYAELLKRDLTVRLDARDLEFTLTTSSIPTPEEFRTGAALMQLEFTAAPALLAPGTHTLALQNQHLPDMSVYLVNAAKPRSDTIQVTQQTRNQNQSTGEIIFTFRPPAKPAPTAGVVTALMGMFAIVFTAAWRLIRKKRVLSSDTASKAMIKHEDIEVQTGRCEGGSFMKVTHRPTGIFRVRLPPLNTPGKTKNELLAEIELELAQRGLSHHILPDE